MGSAGSKASRTLKNSPLKAVTEAGPASSKTNTYGYVIPEKSIDPQQYDPDLLKRIMEEDEKSFDHKDSGLSGMLKELDNTLKPMEGSDLSQDVAARLARTHMAHENLAATQGARIAAHQVRDLYEACARVPDAAGIEQLAQSAGVDAELLKNVLRYSSIPEIRPHPTHRGILYARWHDVQGSSEQQSSS